MNEKIVRVAVFITLSLGFLKASDRQILFATSMKSDQVKDQSVQCHTYLPSYEESVQSYRVSVGVGSSVKQLKKENDLMKQELLSLRALAAQFKTGRDILQDFKDDACSLDCTMVQNEGATCSQEPSCYKDVNVLLDANKVLNQELQALKRWQYFFERGKAVAYRILQNKQ